MFCPEGGCSGLTLFQIGFWIWLATRYDAKLIDNSIQHPGIYIAQCVVTLIIGLTFAVYPWRFAMLRAPVIAQQFIIL